MKKALTIALEDKEVIELMRILMDSDAEGALEFLREHFKGKRATCLKAAEKYKSTSPVREISWLQGICSKNDVP